MSKFIDDQQQIVLKTIDEMNQSKSQMDDKYGDALSERVGLLDSYIKLIQKFVEEKGIQRQDNNGKEFENE